MRSLLVLLMMIPTVFAADAIEQLVGPDKAQRERARRTLIQRGTPALPALRGALKGAKDDATKQYIGGVIRKIEEREPGGLLFGCGLPKMKLTLDVVRSREFKFAISVKNRGADTMVLYPYLSMRVLDAKGEPVKYSRHLGRGGMRRSANALENVKFVTLKPGESWSFKDGVAQYMHDSKWINGWRIADTGTYTLEFTYKFDRVGEKAKCDPKWERLHDANEPWNRTMAIEHKFSQQLVVSP